MKRLPLALLLAPCLVAPAALRAQGDAPADAPKLHPLASIHADRVPELLAAYEKTRFGQLLADEDAKYAADAIVTYARRQIRRQEAVLAAVAEIDVELEPWQVANIYTAGEVSLWKLFRHPVDQVQRAEMLFSVAEDERFGTPRMLTRLSCLPRYEGRWTQDFEGEVAQLRRSRFFEEVKGAKVGGFPAYAFQPPAAIREDESLTQRNLGRWFLHAPGTFVFGSGAGTTEQLEAELHDSRTAPAGVGMQMDLETYVEMFTRTGMGIPQEFSMLGFDKLARLRWTGRFVDDLILDQITVELNGEPSGIIGALVNGKAPLPAQPLPKGALAQLRTAIDIAPVLELFPTFDLPPLPDELVALIEKALTGGVAIGCCRPAPGGLIPRIYASIGVADREALDELIAKMVVRSRETKEVEYDGVRCTTLPIPGAPQAIQPTWCIVGDTLHVAESALSMRALLKTLDSDEVAMDVGDAPIPDGPGELVPSFDLRFDEAKIYAAYHELWLPLFEVAGVNQTPGPVTRDDLPDPDTVADYCGASRGVLRRDGNAFHLQQLGALGGIEAAGLLMTWGPMIAANAASDYQTDQLTYYIAQHKLEKVHAALKKFEAREQRRPKDLFELVDAEKLPEDLLLLPGDDMAETLKGEGGRELRSSYRYFAEPVRFEGNQVVLVEVRPHQFYRATLTTDGQIPQVWGDDNQKSIDRLQAGAGARDEAVEVVDSPATAEAPAGGGGGGGD